MISSLHVPGPSPVHDIRAGWKLLILAALGTVSFLVETLPLMLGMAAGVAALYPLGAVPLRHVWTQTRDLAPFLGLMAAAQVWFDGPLFAGITVARVLCLVWAAGLVTATTAFADMMAVLERLLGPTRRIGFSPSRIAFALTLAVRFIPLLQAMMMETRAAQAARGLGRNPLALAVPLTIRALRLADRVAEAIEARDALPDDAHAAPEETKLGGDQHNTRQQHMSGT